MQKGEHMTKAPIMECHVTKMNFSFVMQMIFPEIRYNPDPIGSNLSSSCTIKIHQITLLYINLHMTIQTHGWMRKIPSEEIGDNRVFLFFIFLFFFFYFFFIF